MCYLGFSSAKKGKRVNWDKVKLLMLLNASRGNKATGLWCPKMVFKATVGAEEFISRAKWDSMNVKHTFWHGRYPTHGENSVPNAHPHTFDNFTVVHNGVLYGYEKKSTDYSGRVCDVDSQVIPMVLQNEGHAGLTDLSGAAALVWYDDRKPNSIFIYRHTNPLFLGEVDGVLYGASIESSLHAIGCNATRSIKEHQVCEIVAGEIVSVIDIVPPKEGSWGNWEDYGYSAGGYNDKYWENYGKNSSKKHQGTVVDHDTAVASLFDEKPKGDVSQSKLEARERATFPSMYDLIQIKNCFWNNKPVYIDNVGDYWGYSKQYMRWMELIEIDDGEWQYYDSFTKKCGEADVYEGNKILSDEEFAERVVHV